MHVPSIAVGHEPNLPFDIPAQPLEAALEAYGNATGRDALYKSDLTSGRRSTAVRGTLPPEAALLALLKGTGLVVSHSTSASFVLLPAPARLTASPPAGVGEFYGNLQTTLQNALCADDAARPGTYRVALRLWIDAAGDIANFERLGTTGTKRIDSAIDRNLRGLRVGSPPPSDLKQPTTVVVLPRAPGVTMGCESLVQRAAKAGR
ncbi:STN domain-containing protein [Hyphomicrobium album]